ncbi:MAG: family 20 glycosylhydrolase [Flavobacteriaceae bacterium]|nr:family 20 glycosylhydrolase [Flavobacteriaceae bacterium]
MTTKQLMLSIVAGLILVSCTPKQKQVNPVQIVPIPVSVKKQEGFFELQKSTVIVADKESKVANYLVQKVAVPTGNQLLVVSEMPKSNYISLEIDKSVKEEEGYTLNADADKVTIKASTDKGLFYGVQTLLQLLPAEIESSKQVSGVDWTVPSVVIVDSPRFPYRGMHLDVCRHFVPVANIKKHLDMMAMLKLNKFHWHLTEDQGWRIEIKAFPKLTQIGSKRTEGDGSTHEGFYTQEQVKDIVKYASDRMIEVIPEIELPGHSLGALTAYPEYSCTGGPFKVRNIWGVEPDVYCAGKEETFEFLNKIIDEVVTLFPSQYFHIGGDECPKERWKKCKLCQKRIRKEKLKNEHELQSYFVQRVEKMLLKHNKKMIGWDEILEGGLAETATVMSWRGEKGGIEAAEQNHDVVMTPGNWCYLDHYQGDYKVEPVAIGGHTTLEESYSYEPVPAKLSADKAKHVLGTQGNVWSEYLYTPEIVEYMVYPRIIALAEVNWAKKESKNFEDFVKRLDNIHLRMDLHHINYHIPIPEGMPEKLAFVDTAKVILQTTRPLKMVYTTDGKEPTESSKEYKEPLKFTENTTLKVASVLPTGKVSPIRTITIEKQSYTLAKEVKTTQKGFKKQGKTEYIGSVDIAEDGVYEFATDVEELYINGKLLISNKGEVKRHSRHNASIALAKGKHPIKVIYNEEEIKGGWPNKWTGLKVRYRKLGTDKMIELK